MTAEMARKLMWAGAAIGAVAAAVAAWALGLDRPTGAIGFHAMAGAATGGFLGFLLGALTGSRREESYLGPERRHDASPYPGVDRRTGT